MKKQGKLDRRVRRTRRQLHSALYDMIKQQPYESITVSDIVDEADISRATFYLHYKDKDELLIGSLEALSQSLIEDLKSREPDTLDLTLLSRLLFEHVEENRQLYLSLQSSHTANFVIPHQMSQLVDTCQISLSTILSDIAEDSVTMDRVAHQLMGMLYGQILWWLQRGLEPSATVMAQHFQSMAMIGLQSMLT